LSWGLNRTVIEETGDKPMKTGIAITTAAAMSLVSAVLTPAAAFHLSPPGDFTGNGPTSATKGGISLPCTAHFTGTVDSDGVGQVTGGSFTDRGAIGCTAVTLQNLPWTAKAVSATKVELLKVTFNSPLGKCGPGNITAALKKGVLKFTAVPLKGGCSVTAKIKTSPKLSIVK
jgi:hypothetical protein